MDSITWWTRFAESSPVIIVVLAAIIFGGFRAGALIVQGLLSRLDKKDAEFADMHKQTLEIVADNATALRELTRAIERGEHR